MLICFVTKAFNLTFYNIRTSHGTFCITLANISYTKIKLCLRRLLTHFCSASLRKSSSPYLTENPKSLVCLLKVMTFFWGYGFIRPNSTRLTVLEGESDSAVSLARTLSNSTCGWKSFVCEIIKWFFFQKKFFLKILC